MIFFVGWGGGSNRNTFFTDIKKIPISAGPVLTVRLQESFNFTIQVWKQHLRPNKWTQIFRIYENLILFSDKTVRPWLFILLLTFIRLTYDYNNHVYIKYIVLSVCNIISWHVHFSSTPFTLTLFPFQFFLPWISV